MRWIASCLVVAIGTMAGAETVRTEAAGLRFSVDKSWTRTPAASDMRAAQFRITRTDGDTEDGELVLFFFGEGKGGSVQENLDRWYGQFTQPDGGSSRDAAVVTMKTVGNLKITAADLTGTYRGMGPHEGQSKPKTRMLAAVVEGPGGPWFLRAVGPSATIARAKDAFDALLGSLEAHR